LRFGRAVLRWAAAAILAMTVVAPAFGSSQTLAQVKARGSLVCGVNEGLPGFSFVDERGVWSGFDVDFCRALAAAIFGDASKVKLAPLSADARFQALRDGKIDVLSRNSTWTMGRETEFGLTFVGVTYFDGQGFMVPRALHVNSALELDGAKVCAQSGTTTIDNLADFFASNKMTLEEVVSSSADESIKNYDAGLCSVLTSDLSQLYALRLRLSKPKDHVILPDVISKEPLGPVVRDDDLQWINIVKWVHFVMINAEELGVSSRTIDSALHRQSRR
jgi:general L-amino acid transport system substrate-binding protein